VKHMATGVDLGGSGLPPLFAVEVLHANAARLLLLYRIICIVGALGDALRENVSKRGRPCHQDSGSFFLIGVRVGSRLQPLPRISFRWLSCIIDCVRL